MTTVYYWRVYCTTDNQYEYVWNDSEPTVCPVNNSHTIDSSLTTILDTLGENIVEIKEENTSTGGYYRAITRKITATANSTSVNDYTFPVPIAVYTIFFNTTSDHEGDVVSLEIAPNSNIGVVNADVSAGDTVFTVNSTVIDNAKLGFYITLNDGTNTDEVGQVVAIDEVNSTITVENPTTNSFLASTPTYVESTLVRVKDLEIGPPGEYKLGTGKIGGSYVPANTTIRVIYVNNGSNTKNTIFLIEHTF